MTPANVPSSPADSPRFSCSWRSDGIDAASVHATGTLDHDSVSQLELAIDEALARARLVLLDVHEASFVGPVGARAITRAAAHAARAGARLVVVGAADALQVALHEPNMGAQLNILDPAPTGERPRRQSAQADPVAGLIRPFDNPVNARVLTARAMSIAAQELWFHGDDGSVGRAWAPPHEEGFPVPPGSPVEVYFDGQGDVNGWRDPMTGLAVNQRLLDPLAAPETASAAACQGRCGLVWQAPAATRLTEHDERCLTCAGPLVLR